MYFNIYYNDFFLNFLPSLLVIFLVYISAEALNFRLKQKYNVILGEFGSVIIFFLIFAFFCTFVNIFLIFGKVNYISYFVYLFLIILFFGSISHLVSIYPFKKFNKYNFSKLVLIILFFFILISILPLSDADSISSHLYLPLKIILSNKIDFNLLKDLELISFSNNEIILFLSVILKSDNFGSILNVFTLVLFYFFLKTKTNFFFILITCPIILFLISTQKLQLFFGLMYLLIAIIIFEKKYSNNYEKTALIFLSVFYATGKTYYLLFIIPLILIFLIQNKKDLFKLSFIYFSAFLLLYAPILLIKYNLFGDPFAPFLSSIFSSNDVNKIISGSLRSSEGWLEKSLDIEMLIRPFLVLKVNEYTTSLGIFFLISLFKFKEIKKIFYLPYLLIILILLTGQILPRYYFEAFLLLCYFTNLNFKNIFFKLFLSFQYLVIFSASVLSLFTFYFKYNVFFDKNYFMENVSYQYFNAKNINKELIDRYIDNNTLNFGQSRESIFMKSNVFGSRYLNAFRNLNGEIDVVEFNKFILQNKIKYIIGKVELNEKDCFQLNKITQLNQLNVRRNPLKERVPFTLPLSEISDNICKD